MTHDSIFDDPEARAWAQQAIDELVPQLRNSAATISVVPENVGIGDIKFALETGMTLLLGKPLILAVVPGRQVPAGLARAADRIIDFDETNPARTARQIQQVLEELAPDDPDELMRDGW